MSQSIKQELLFSNEKYLRFQEIDYSLDFLARFLPMTEENANKLVSVYFDLHFYTYGQRKTCPNSQDYFFLVRTYAEAS